MQKTSHQAPDKEAAWQRLEEHALEARSRHLSALFANDQNRFRTFSQQAGPLLLDFSKQRMDTSTLRLLAELADASGLRQWIAALFAGANVNNTEGRAAMHWALRLPPDDKSSANKAVQAELDKMAAMVDKLHAGQWRGFSGEPITNVVNIGVGGSDLGPLVVSHALREMAYGDELGLQLHFVSSMDGSQLSQLLTELRPQNTLFVIASKSFTTVDTLSNAATARSWLISRFGDDPAVTACHFIGVSASPEKMTAWGIPDARQLELWDWVGGRFSLWSAIGLTIAVRIGMAGFREMLAGAHFMDSHFREADWRENLPVLLALIGVWNGNFLGINAHAVLPYDGRLRYLPGYLSQLEMESNGKSVSREGLPIGRKTCPILWGDVGPNAQHAFYQLLHQGTQPVSSDFIVPIRRYHTGAGHDQAAQLTGQHLLTLANCLAQSRLLAFGEGALPTEEQVPLYRRYHGNQPSSTLLLEEITPFSMGALLALYEHKVFAQAVIWGINPFDQWGVEMGKRIAGETLELLGGRGEPGGMDASTEGLMAAILKGMPTPDREAD